MRAMLIAVGFVATVFSGGVSAGQPAAGAVPANTPGASMPATGADITPATPPDTYTYEPAGRRDPFLTVLGTGLEPRAMSRRGAGIAGMVTADISVRGVMQTGAAFIALVQGADTRTYVVHAGDKLLDGTVKTITPDGLTIVQDVNDPLSLVKTREVRKLLRSKEDAKP